MQQNSSHKACTALVPPTLCLKLSSPALFRSGPGQAALPSIGHTENVYHAAPKKLNEEAL
jgi:hypothetical protein